ncbi:hypothetical protein PC117_g11526 [Phytophthora cactorum]|uniref:Uncharacterized protein n=1 Tax=Phytophthora cactorum TaxID=29920 RepID=A0A8T1DCR0_9STRA|nr:hypothetical protein PC117_g11526 [Phytophthora cactorum]
MTKQEIKDQRTRKHMNDLLAKTAEQFESAGDTKCVVQIKLLILPVEILADEMDLTGVGAIRGEDKARGRTSSNGKKHPVVGLCCTGWVKRGWHQQNSV